MKVSTGQLARRYATALYESAVEAKQIDTLVGEATALLGVLNAQLEAFFASPARSATEKQSLVDTLVEKMKLSPMTSRTLNLMTENNRLPHIKLVMQKVLEKIDAHKNIVRGQIRSATAMSAQEIADLEKTMSQAQGRTVVFECETDPELRAGMVVKIGTSQIDASLKTRLSNLKESLSQGV
ncbi:MAG: ATP synthase F1 subunit delta [Silvanigrellaceae bacterium]